MPGTETSCAYHGLLIGLDVGSTTVKAVVVDAARDAILWQDYQRHETKQAEKVLEFLEASKAAFPDVPSHRIRLFVTGSDGAALLECTSVASSFRRSTSSPLPLKSSTPRCRVSLSLADRMPRSFSSRRAGSQAARI